MPLRPPQNVQIAVSYAIHHAIQTRLQAEVDSVGAPGSLDPASLQALRAIRTTAHNVRRKDHVCYIRVLIEYSDRKVETHSWRVPTTTSAGLRPGLNYPGTWVQRLDNQSSMHTLSGAWAGTGRPAEGPAASRSRSRPEIGRARKRRGR
jgi:hypothetical protein